MKIKITCPKCGADFSILPTKATQEIERLRAENLRLMAEVREIRDIAKAGDIFGSIFGGGK